MREKEDELRLRIQTLHHIVQTDSTIDVTYYRTRIMQQLTGIPPPPIPRGGKLITLADIVGDAFEHAALLDLAPRVRD
eukprot:3535177-Rhodomonas_salina.1